jgi:hypothetical protein
MTAMRSLNHGSMDQRLEIYDLAMVRQGDQLSGTWVWVFGCHAMNEVSWECHVQHIFHHIATEGSKSRVLNLAGRSGSWLHSQPPRMESVHRRRVRDFQKAETTVQVEAWQELSQGAQADICGWQMFTFAIAKHESVLEDHGSCSAPEL